MKIKIISQKAYNKKYGKKNHFCIPYENWQDLFGKTFDVLEEDGNDKCCKINDKWGWWIPFNCCSIVKPKPRAKK